MVQSPVGENVQREAATAALHPSWDDYKHIKHTPVACNSDAHSHFAQASLMLLDTRRHSSRGLASIFAAQI